MNEPIPIGRNATFFPSNVGSVVPVEVSSVQLVLSSMKSQAARAARLSLVEPLNDGTVPPGMGVAHE